MEEGDLQDVVRGCTNFAPNWFSATTQQQDHGDFDFIYSSSFSDLFETSRVLDELEELYKPFYPKTTLLSSSSSLSDSASSIKQTDTEKLKKDEPVMFTGSTSAPVSAAPTSSSHHHETKYKRRKNQQKRVVHQVAAQGVSTDTWAWRKYGQKPIKGSPYPRSYYRCSSMKGCLARKQLERSPTNPDTFVITYTAEHCHPRPTKKSSLAGTTRQKFSSTATATAATSMISSPASTTLSPPQSSPAATMEDSELSPHGFSNETTIDGDNEKLMYDPRFYEVLDDLRYDLTYTSGFSQDQNPMIFPAC